VPNFFQSLGENNARLINHFSELKVRFSRKRQDIICAKFFSKFRRKQCAFDKSPNILKLLNSF